MKKMLVTFVMVLSVLFSVTTPAFAGSGYTDVTKAKVGESAYKAITYIKKYGGWKDVANGKKFYPNRKITRREFLTVLGNLYGDQRVPANFQDVRYANKTITAEWACKRMVAQAKVLGLTITWKGGNTVLTRKSAAQYMTVFCKFDPALKPQPRK
ncbi:hypothetical protein J6S37_01585 [Candidatus Saccharibacteria bacterium]|nr:hypothetical protein [Candidatus Saccharibacteria bacterium]